MPASGHVSWKLTLPNTAYGRFVYTVGCSAKEREGKRRRASGHVVMTIASIPELPPTGAGTVVAPGELGPGRILRASQSVFSPTRQYQLIMQSDGNLVLYTQGTALWDSGTQGHPGAYAIMQTDGNLVVYSSSEKVLWNSRTQGHKFAFLNVQDDGNLVVYDVASQPLWSSGTINYRLLPGQQLIGSESQSLYSPNEQYQLVMQDDGNLVLYSEGTPLWASWTQGHPGAHAIMQTDGNLVVYGPSGKALWDSGTQGHSGAWLNVQNDGNLVVYSSSNTALWSTGTVQSTLAPGHNLRASQSIYSPAERYQLIMQSDGNLVLYGPGNSALWNSKTEGHPGAYAIMQTDGNLVVYSSSGQALWDSGTQGHPGAKLVLQDDGNLVIYLNGQALWDTGTETPPSYAGSDPAALRVAAAAQSYDGQVTVPGWYASADKIGPYWSGYCEAFVTLVAYGGRNGYPSAYDDYLARKRAGLIHYGVPPRGAIVYWDPEDSADGHIGISLGGGEVISTMGWGGQKLPIEEHRYTFFGNYLGWAMPY